MCLRWLSRKKFPGGSEAGNWWLPRGIIFNQSEQEEKAAQLEEMEEKLTEYRKVKEDVQEWAGLIRQYRDADILDRDMLLKLIDRIEVGEACVVNGQKERQIRICYKFAGDIG